MKLTTKGRYAVTAMLDLALHNDNAPVCLADISARQDISLAYLEKLFGKLRKNGLVKSVRGPGGGYHLAQSADEITPAHVIYAVDEPIDATLCGGQQNCAGDTCCLTHDLWMGLNLNIAEYLNGVSLGEIIRMNNVKKVANRQDATLIRRDIHIGATT